VRGKNCWEGFGVGLVPGPFGMPDKKIRFDDFELDFGRFQLFRAGQPVRLEGLPLQLLMYLIEHHRQLVTREQIADALWGKDVFVDVEQGINTAIRKVRRALEDDSDQPQYLQTVVGRGYRFVAPLTVVQGDSQPAASPTVSLEELGQAIMAAAGLRPEETKPKPKGEDES
jgi:DNA-binding winged helix-turn-helix (wHTH) protein